MIEKRYAGENAMMDAVRTGNLKKVDTHVGRITAAVFDKRLPDHLRTLKNYCIITNTLLRKAAEQGGVHPVYLDSVSSDFAAKIEQISSPSACPAMIGSMARSYCRLVKNHSAKSYSPAVQKAMICVDTDLTAPLSLRYLADELNINSSYLSSLFKKETGLTVTAYIIRQRINYAKHLLENTRLQIQTVAQHCGLGDVHYFSKLFKKETGVTPREFRQSVQ
jgi:YesN/AraC family two-component response regulator